MWHKITFNSPVVLSFVFLCLFTFLLNLITGGAANRMLFTVYPTSFSDPLAYVRLFTHTLGHISWSHYMNNMLLLLIVGPLLEEKYGSRNLLFIMAITALASGIANNLLFSNQALLGASGIVFAFILLSSITSMREKKIPATFLLVAIIYIGGQIIEGMFTENNISNLTHIIGGIVGSLAGYILNNKANKLSAS